MNNKVSKFLSESRNCIFECNLINSKTPNNKSSLYKD